ncbi:MAG: DUF421 domain-containing protein [Clostridia bacterium]|nr:DUF421 domain-containing protein [Clostridia bacterium]
MIILKAGLTSILSMILLFLMTKLTGDKQMSQMSAFDYIVGITIGSSAAEMAIGGEVFLPAAVATFLYGFVAFLISWFCNKSLKLRRFLNGEPVILFKNGVFYKKNMARVRMDMGEFLTQCRTNGYFSLKDITSVIMESNGKLSFLKKIQDKNAEFTANLIIDGEILRENLIKVEKSDWWLMNEVDKRGLKVSEIMLATLDAGKLYIYPFSQKEEKNNLFE